jgi:AcrR family transcriptional regulator
MTERGRPRSFDKEKALASAMRIFWEKGFEQTSLADLTTAMKIAPPSLYAAFGSKEGLFLEALDLYRTTINPEIRDALLSEGPVKEAIQGFLERSAEAYSRLGLPSGCMVVLGAHAPETETGPLQEGLKLARTETMDLIRDRLALAMERGELPRHVDAQSTANFLGTLQMGMSILARDGADAQTLLAVARNGTAAFEALAGLGASSDRT